MRRLVVCCAFLLLSCVPSQASPTPPEGFKFKVEEEINTLLRQFAEAQKNYDARVLDEILAPDYVEISPLGEVDPRAKVLGFYAPENKERARRRTGVLRVRRNDGAHLWRHGDYRRAAAFHVEDSRRANFEPRPPVYHRLPQNARQVVHRLRAVHGHQAAGSGEVLRFNIAVLVSEAEREGRPGRMTVRRKFFL